jgi:fatty-acyl-CoA synthase
MLGLMQDWPLTVGRTLAHGRALYPHREIVTRTVEGPIVRETYAQMWDRSKQVSHALAELDVKLGDRVATLAWNNARHMETWFGAMGIGAVVHTLNPRLHPDQIAWIATHGGGETLCTDLTFLPLLEKIENQLPLVKRFIVYCDGAGMPQTSLKNAIAYETLIAGRPLDTLWDNFSEETAAGLCYTSGTTGEPKGVLYSHRSNLLHAMAVNQGDSWGLRSRDTILAVVPMFHANGWTLPFVAPMTGCKLVMPGPKLDAASLYEQIEAEGVTMAAGVPTIWNGLVSYMQDNKLKPKTLERVLIGGAAASESLVRAFEVEFGIEVAHAWGMTEMSPGGTTGTLCPIMSARDHDDRIKQKTKQGRPLFTVEMRIADEAGREVAHDGKTPGRLLVRGPAISKAYFRGEGARNADGTVLEPDGYFDTGDIATLDQYGYVQITDRAKDVIKSGGEWISSIEIENIVLGAPGVACAAVIGAAHPKWDERPLLIVEPKTGAAPDRDALLAYLDGKIAKWWTPDDVVLVEKIPLGATGKIDKVALRKQFKDYVLPGV